ncbi:MFS transporter [Chryseobacterium carnipullorum]|uniref:Dipeptide and tripeptide permease B n=1 Tax=Chryseobacterium carnipullorum TaxID=1124835 RepID=A0A1M7E0N3_CHRCU|nr:peptide MFS transporter [Chryseobacterium carnipullorum]MDN5395766.1 peptide MFS transporter [Chryseobacterium sp.]AZA46957.1 MFS transporter [Chryseobacterium carnipullorum]AZA66310.1 MFS transporter [Chryseobacterium carnipullorum]MDN5476026.1 peptide MFS transporter [Chryseobacterium sp.]SHL85325.1 proton-dependent oligopeptide transporter, POT family [Chryseobacterium carnipullorum]
MSLTLDEIQNFKGKYPRQIWSLFFSEMWERFCFYGMRGMLVFFMISQLNFHEKEANLQYGATQAFVYAFTFVGGLFADKILGFRKSLFWGGLLMIVGSLILAADPHQFFFLGIAFTVVGTGFFKPNISSMVGQLYKPNDSRADAGFSLFYAGINLGALLGGYLCIAIGKGEILGGMISEAMRWNVAFGLASVVMVISLINFIFTQRRMGTIGLQPGHPLAEIKSAPIPKWKEYGVYVLSLIFVPIIMKMVAKTEYTDYFMWTIGPLTLIYLFYEMSKVTASERKKLWAALVFIIFSIIFWGIYEQSGGSLSIFAAKNLNKDLLGLDPNGVNNSGGAFFIIFLAPLIGLLWIWLNKRKIEPNTIVKFGLGFIFLGIGYYVLFATRLFADLQGITSLNFFTLALLIITLGELCLSPIGLSIMTKLSTKNLQGMMMGMWFLASAYGQYVAGIIGAGLATAKEGSTNYDVLITYTDGYKQLGLYAVIAGVVLILISPFVKKLMQEVK